MYVCDIHTYYCVCMYTRMHACMYACVYAKTDDIIYLIYAHTHSHTRMHAHTQARTHACTHAHTHVRTHTRTHRGKSYADLLKCLSARCKQGDMFLLLVEGLKINHVENLLFIQDCEYVILFHWDLFKDIYFDFGVPNTCCVSKSK